MSLIKALVRVMRCHASRARAHARASAVASTPAIVSTDDDDDEEEREGGREGAPSDREGERVTAAFDWFVCFSCL